MSKKRQILFGLAVFIIVAFICNMPGLLSAHRQRVALEATFQQYSNAIVARDYPAAYSYYGSAFKTAITLQDFIAQERSFESKLGRIKSTNVAGFYMHGRGSPMVWTALIREVRRYENGEVHLLCEFHFEDGRWQLFGYKQIT